MNAEKPYVLTSTPDAPGWRGGSPLPEPSHLPDVDSTMPQRLSTDETLVLSDPELAELVFPSQPTLVGHAPHSSERSLDTMATLQGDSGQQTSNSQESLEDMPTVVLSTDSSAQGEEPAALNGEPSLRTTRLPAGQTFGSLKLGDRFTLLGLVGVGGMGNVYRAFDQELEEVVALKMLRHERISAPGVLKRFRQEVRLARRITHPNIARMYDIGEVDGERFLTMEFVEGETLASCIAKQGKLGVERTLRIAVQLCSGLDAAHRAGVVHRDLKPDNVLLGKEGRSVITDFGIAWPLADGEGTSPGQPGLAGTPAYMAPEQVQGRPLDARVDLYALGLILMEMLSGKPVWRAQSLPELLSIRLHTPPPRLSVIRPDLPAKLDLLLQQLLALDPDNRPSSAAEVRIQLEAMLTALPAETALNSGLPSTSPAPDLIAPKPSERVPTLAVLPFQNQSGAEHDWLSEGITEDLIDTLSMQPALRVRSRSMTHTLKNFDGDIRLLGKQLEVTSVLQGSVRRVGERVRVTARLTCTTDGIQLRAIRLERPIEDTLMLAEALAQELMSALPGQALPTTRTTPTHPKALELYLKARREYSKAWAENNQIALELFAQAHQLAPEDPLLMAGYAMSLARRYGEGQVPPGQDRVARQLAEQALRMVPNLGEARMALAWLDLHMGLNPQAVSHARLAMKAAPGLADPYELLGRLLTEAGDLDRGRQMFQTALLLDPTQLHIHATLARIMALEGFVEEATSALEALPDFDYLLGFKWVSLARIAGWYRQASRIPPLIARLEPLHFPLAAKLVSLLRLYGANSMPQEVEEYLTSFATDPRSTARMRSFGCQLMLESLCNIGQFEKCWFWLEVANQEALLDLHWLERCPNLVPLRQDKRWPGTHQQFLVRATQTIRAFDET